MLGLVSIFAMISEGSATTGLRSNGAVRYPYPLGLGRDELNQFRDSVMAALRSLDPAVKVRVLLPERTKVRPSDPN